MVVESHYRVVYTRAALFVACTVQAEAQTEVRINAPDVDTRLSVTFLISRYEKTSSLVDDIYSRGAKYSIHRDLREFKEVMRDASNLGSE